VYFIYGNYFCCNAVCARPGAAEAVLIRAIEPGFNMSWLQHNRPVKSLRELTSGPAKLCLAMGIDRLFDGLELTEATSDLILAHNPNRRKFLRGRGPIFTTTRIGLSVATHLPLRFYLPGSEFISKHDAVPRSRSRRD
jgi:DNA-3-methyladenine glycosylase